MEIAESIEATRQSVIRMFQVLERAALLIMLYSGKNNMQQLAKPEKVAEFNLQMQQNSD